METVLLVLVAIIAIEGGIIAYQLRSIGRPWFLNLKQDVEEGIIKETAIREKIPELRPSDGVVGSLHFIGCALKHQIVMDNQRFKIQSGSSEK